MSRKKTPTEIISAGPFSLDSSLGVDFNVSISRLH